MWNRHLIILALIFLLGIATIVSSLIGLYSFNNSIHALESKWIPRMELLGDLRFRVTRLRMLQMRQLIESDEEIQASVQELIDKTKENIEQSKEEYKLQLNTEEEEQLYTELEAQYKDYSKQFDKIQNLFKENRVDEAKRYLLEEALQTFQRIIDSINSLKDLDDIGLERAIEENQSRYKSIMMWNIGSLLVMLAGVGVLAVDHFKPFGFSIGAASVVEDQTIDGIEEVDRRLPDDINKEVLDSGNTTKEVITTTGSVTPAKIVNPIQINALTKIANKVLCSKYPKIIEDASVLHSLPDGVVLSYSTLFDYNILDTPPEESFDEVSQLAADICNASVAFISLFDLNRQWIKAKVGMGEIEIPGDTLLGLTGVEESEPFIVEDTLADERVKHDSSLSSTPRIRFYTRIPLVTSTGHMIGMICIIDAVSHTLNAAQLTTLLALRDHVMQQLESRRSS
jgi:molecular chaperone GrpE (heat shock protein)